jgi:hypothetical protein
MPEFLRKIAEYPGFESASDQQFKQTNPPESNPRDSLAIREISSTSVFRHVRKCEELRGSAFGHTIGHVVRAI